MEIRDFVCVIFFGRDLLINRPSHSFQPLTLWLCRCKDISMSMVGLFEESGQDMLESTEWTGVVGSVVLRDNLMIFVA